MPHTRWKGIKPIPNQHLNTIQLAYVRGYILGCEDFLKDLETLIPDEPMTSAESLSDWDRGSLTGRQYAIGTMYGIVKDTLDNAKRTMKALDPEGTQNHEYSE